MRKVLQLGHRAIWSMRRAGRWLAPRDIRRNVTVQRAISTRDLHDEPSRAQRTVHAISSLVRDAPASGTIWGVSMVRNEADIIEETIINLIEQGVDRVLVADNGSTDATAHILHFLARTLPVDVVEDPVPAFWQAEKVTLLARAATRMGASWIVPFDADEVWCGYEGRTVAEVLRSTDATIVTAEWFDFIPHRQQPGPRVVDRFPYRLAQPASLHKVAFRANWLARVTHGNHSVTLPAPLRADGLRIAHYRYRSVDQMLQKAQEGSGGIRCSGLPIQVSYWSSVADGGPERAEAILEELAQRELVFDPASRWIERHGSGPAP